jgi:hypothetical protein
MLAGCDDRIVQVLKTDGTLVVVLDTELK